MPRAGCLRRGYLGTGDGGAMHIADWDDAYANRDHIPGADEFITRWVDQAAAFRAAHNAELDLQYGPGPRHRFDLFRPKGAPVGLIVFVHGGYWRAFDKSYWSHLAAGPLAAVWAVAMPSYTLVPDCSIAAITTETTKAIAAAAALILGRSDWLDIPLAAIW